MVRQSSRPIHRLSTSRAAVLAKLAEPAGRGRPAWLYAATGSGSFDVEYAGLAAALARTVVRTSDRPANAAALAGEEWGRELARARGAGPSRPEEARRHVLKVLDDLGFQCETDDRSPAEVRLTRCPLLEAAYRHQEVVCAVHVGLVRGVLQENGADPAGTQLSPFSEPHACGLVVPALPEPSRARCASGPPGSLPP